MKTPGIITGLAQEADCLSVFDECDRPMIGITAADPRRIRDLVQGMVGDGCRGIISFGMAGGLAPDLRPGQTIIADQVVSIDGGRYPTDAIWRNALVGSLEQKIDVLISSVAGVEETVTGSVSKYNLFETTQAVAVDMESLGVARAASDLGIPFLVVRSIADPVTRSLPSWVAGCLDDFGAIKTGAVIAGLLRQPSTLMALPGLARESRKALQALRRVALLAGPDFRLSGAVGQG